MHFLSLSCIFRICLTIKYVRLYVYNNNNNTNNNNDNNNNNNNNNNTDNNNNDNNNNNNESLLYSAILQWKLLDSLRCSTTRNHSTYVCHVVFRTCNVYNCMQSKGQFLC